MFNKQFNIQANPLYSIIYLSSATAHHKSFRIIFSLFSTAVYLPFQSHVQASQILISQHKSGSHINNLLPEFFHFQ